MSAARPETTLRVLLALALIVALGLVVWRSLGAQPDGRAAGVERDAASRTERAADRPPGTTTLERHVGSEGGTERAVVSVADEEPPAELASESGAAPRREFVDLSLRFVDPMRERVDLGAATLVLEAEGGARRSVSHEGGPIADVSGMASGRWTLRVETEGYRHREQVLELRVNPDPSAPDRWGALGGKPTVDEHVVLWPEAWVAVVLRSADGRPFAAIAEELGLEPKRLFVDAFEVRARRSAPEVGGAGAHLDAATWHKPPTWQAWSLPGSVAGSLELHEAPPLWVGLVIHGRVHGWELLRPSDDAVLFTVDTADFVERFATLSLRVLGAAGGAPRTDALATLKANTSAHRRADLSHVAPDDEGLIRFERVIPGHHGLAVTAGDALHQAQVRLAPGEQLDLGDVVLPNGPGVQLRVVDPQGAPVTAWVELAPFRPGAHVDELYHPNLHRQTDDEGRYSLPRVSEPSILRVARAAGGRGHLTGEMSRNVLLDPEALPRELELVVHEPRRVVCELLDPGAAAVEVRDELSLVIGVRRQDVDQPPAFELVPGRYRGRALGARVLSRGEVEFTVGDGPLQVIVP